MHLQELRERNPRRAQYPVRHGIASRVWRSCHRKSGAYACHTTGMRRGKGVSCVMLVEEYDRTIMHGDLPRQLDRDRRTELLGRQTTIPRRQGSITFTLV